MARNSVRRLFIAAALLPLTVALLLVLRPPGAPYLDLLRQGDAHAAEAERSAAIAAYRQALLLHADDPAAYLRMARVYLDWGRIDEAQAALSQAQRLGVAETDRAAAERLWVEVLVARADWDAVAEHARQWLLLDPAARDARYTLARACLELREWSEARAAYEALLQANPADSLAHERLGALLLGYDPSAVQHLYAAGTEFADHLLAAMAESAGADDPAYTSAQVGRVFFEQGEWMLAARQFRRAVLFNPAYADAHAYLGYAFDQIGWAGEAQSHLLQAVDLAPDSVMAHLFLGLHYERLGDIPAARAEYEAAYDLDPANPATCAAIGQTWIYEGRYVAAEIWLVQAVALRPDEPVFREALTHFYVDHAIVFADKGVGAAEAWVALAPADARAHDLLGWAVFQIGKHDAAEQHLLHALSLDLLLAPAHYHLGVLRKAQGDMQAAREAFTRAVDLDVTGDLVPLVERALGELP